MITWFDHVTRQCPYMALHTFSCPLAKIGALLKKALELQENAHMINGNVHPPFGTPSFHYGGGEGNLPNPQFTVGGRGGGGSKIVIPESFRRASRHHPAQSQRDPEHHCQHPHGGNLKQQTEEVCKQLSSVDSVIQHKTGGS